MNTTLQAMTAIDTTNLALTFTAPASGRVMVRMGCAVHGATTFSQFLLGVLTHGTATVIGRIAPQTAVQGTALATTINHIEGQFVVTGLTPSSSYTWDAAAGVEVAVTTSRLKYGGPNNTTANDAFGGFAYEIWSA